MDRKPMKDSLHEASSNPAFKMLAGIAAFLLGIVVSLTAFVFTRTDSDARDGRAELTKSIQDLRGDLQQFSRTLQDQQTSMMLMQSRVTNLETVTSTTRDNLAKVRDDVQRDAFRIDRLEDTVNIPRAQAPRGNR